MKFLVMLLVLLLPLSVFAQEKGERGPRQDEDRTPQEALPPAALRGAAAKVCDCQGRGNQAEAYPGRRAYG